MYSTNRTERQQLHQEDPALNQQRKRIPSFNNKATNETSANRDSGVFDDFNPTAYEEFSADNLIVSNDNCCNPTTNTEINPETSEDYFSGSSSEEESPESESFSENSISIGNLDKQITASCSSIDSNSSSCPSQEYSCLCDTSDEGPSVENRSLLHEAHPVYKRFNTSNIGLVSTDSSSCEDISCTSFQEDENPTDIEIKMAETEIKMNDSILSNGREDLSYLNEKFRLFMLQKGRIEEELRSMKGDVHLKDINNIKNNNNGSYPCLYNQSECKKIPGHTMKIENLESYNKYSSSIESPIVDAYEKECQGTPEKLEKEVNEIKEEKTLPDTKQLGQTKSELTKNLQIIARLKEMEQALEDKKNGFRSNSLPSFGDGLRHRPSPKQRRKERNALRRTLPHSVFSRSTDSQRSSSPDIGDFDVYTMESSLPKIDWDTIETHLKATGEEEKRRSTDREEIRKKLAMGTDDDFMQEKPGRKPSLHSRLQNGMSLQICFMNETASDCESQCSDTESTQDRGDDGDINFCNKDSKAVESDMPPADFVSQQARLQAEARFALAQAKEMARMQMQIEKQTLQKSPVSEIVRHSFTKIGFPFPNSKRRMSRQILTDMNVAQLQVIVNDFHCQIENLNEALVKLLLERDDLHMEQDSMLVDIEDLTKHLGAKQPLAMTTKLPKGKLQKPLFTKGPKTIKVGAHK